MTRIQEAFIIFSEHYKANVEVNELLCNDIACRECGYNARDDDVESLDKCIMINTLLTSEDVQEIEELQYQYPEYFV